MDVKEIKEIKTSWDEVQHAFFEEMRDHKSWCGNIQECHVYILLQRAMSGIAAKQLDFNKELK